MSVSNTSISTKRGLSTLHMKIKISLSLLALLVSISVLAQSGLISKKKNNPFNIETPPKWMLGIKAGYNKSRINIMEGYSVFSPLYLASSVKDKAYDKKKTSGYQLGLSAIYFPIKNVGISITPTLFTFRYAYINDYEWKGENPAALSYFLQHKHNHNLRYLELPILLKLYPINGQIHAFFQGGGYISKLINAKKTIEITGIENPGESQFISVQTMQSMDVNDLYIKSYGGWIIGGGTGFNADTFRFSLEVNYRKGINNIINEKKRFSNNQLTNAYFDVQDDISINNIEVSLSCVLPLDNLVHVSNKGDKLKKKKR